MQTIQILCIGKLKEAYWREACGEYGKRLGAFCKLSVTELKEARLPEHPSPGEIRQALRAEKEEIQKQLAPDTLLVALCVEGERMSSPALSAWMAEKAARGVSRVAFIIGSSFGLDDEISKRADLTLSFSDMTFPHQMMRVLLLEQLYRAYMIAAGRDYHK